MPKLYPESLSGLPEELLLAATRRARLELLEEHYRQGLRGDLRLLKPDLATVALDFDAWKKRWLTLDHLLEDRLAKNAELGGQNVAPEK